MKERCSMKDFGCVGGNLRLRSEYELGASLSFAISISRLIGWRLETIDFGRNVAGSDPRRPLDILARGFEIQVGEIVAQVEHTCRRRIGGCRFFWVTIKING